ncbi:MAG: alanine racemase, partial [Pseudomonadota bacterium]
RQSGINKRIILLSGFHNQEQLNALRAYEIETVIHCLSQVELLEHYRGLKPKITIWIKIDTGMNRLGFQSHQFAEIYQRLIACPIVNAQLHLMTHFASADQKQNPQTQIQLAQFERIVQQYSEPLSLANSAAILAWNATHKNWVRPGIMLYGISPFAEHIGQELGLEPVMNLYSQLIAIKMIAAGETVGYNQTWTCERPSRIGVVAIGYADGYPRYAPSGTPVLINQQRCPLVGRVSMDMLTVDLTEYPEAKVGDKVLLWGRELPIEPLAKAAQTIPYTLVCGVTQRVTRVYLKDKTCLNSDSFL